MYDLQDWAAVQRVYKQTRSKRATAKILGMSRNTVRSLLEEKEAPVYKRTVYKSKIDGFKEQIIEWRCEPFLFNGTRIFRELKARGYTGSIGPVYRYLSKIEEDIKDHISSKATVRHESPPGDQAQFDWSPYNVPVDGVIITVYCFSMILSASRKKAVCFSLKADAAAIYEAIQELFEDLGGVTLELLIDNPTALVIENNPRNEMEIRYNPHEDFLIMLLQAEETGKKRRQAERLTDAANFDSDKRLSDIDYRFNPNLDADKIQSLGRLEFMDNHENIIIIGPPGVGKSMIATGIGRNACEAGYKVLFVNAKELVDQLYEDMQKGYLKETLKQISKIPLLIIDELSYLKMDKERESLFFQIIRQRYEKSSLIITTNLPMGRWDELFTGKLAAAAILDRLVHHCHVISITGDSYRVKGPKTEY